MAIFIVTSATTRVSKITFKWKSGNQGSAPERPKTSGSWKKHTRSCSMRSIIVFHLLDYGIAFNSGVSTKYYRWVVRRYVVAFLFSVLHSPDKCNRSWYITFGIFKKHRRLYSKTRSYFRFLIQTRLISSRHLPRRQPTTRL